jgi:hypothetical protein
MVAWERAVSMVTKGFLYSLLVHFSDRNYSKPTLRRMAASVRDESIGMIERLINFRTIVKFLSAAREQINAGGVGYPAVRKGPVAMFGRSLRPEMLNRVVDTSVKVIISRKF